MAVTLLRDVRNVDEVRIKDQLVVVNLGTGDDEAERLDKQFPTSLNLKL